MPDTLTLINDAVDRQDVEWLKLVEEPHEFYGDPALMHIVISDALREAKYEAGVMEMRPDGVPSEYMPSSIYHCIIDQLVAERLGLV